MGNLIFSLNATLPVFGVILIGYVLGRIGLVDEPFIRTANRLNFQITLPALLIKDISQANIRDVWDGKYVLFCATVTTICFFGIWGFAKKVLKDASIRGAFVQASFRSSAAVLGLAFIQNMYGNSGMAPLMIIGSVPLYNMYSVIVLTFEANSQKQYGNKKEKIKQAMINIAKNPIIWGIAIGLLCSILSISFPVVVSKTLSNVAAIATPLALLVIGAGFEGRAALAKMKPTLAAAFIKLILQASLFLPAAIALGFREEKLISLLIMLAAPATPSCYIIAKQMDNDGVLSASIVVTTTALAAFTLTGFIFVLKAFNFI